MNLREIYMLNEKVSFRSFLSLLSTRKSGSHCRHTNMALQPFDDKRGPCGTLGWWISLEEAQERSCGNEKWWTIPAADGRVVPVRQYDTNLGTGGPLDKPVWLYNQRDMYLGEWEDFESTFVPGDLYPMEHGFGIAFRGAPDPERGLIFIGEWVKGFCCGSNGKATWLTRSCDTWRRDHWPGSKTIKHGTIHVPFDYVGPFDENGLWGGNEAATVTLKNGTQGYGKWRDGFPVGHFWADHVRLEPIVVNPDGKNRGARRLERRVREARRYDYLTGLESAEIDNDLTYLDIVVSFTITCCITRCCCIRACFNKFRCNHHGCIHKLGTKFTT